MRLMLLAALLGGLAISTSAVAAPAQSGKSPSQQRALARCEKVKAPDSRQACQNRATATKRAARKPQNAQRKPAARKPSTTPAAVDASPSG